MTQPPTPPADRKPNPPEVKFTQEVRFAVVMYGGSSLAIYMNGVAQELLRLVRSTAPAREPGGAAGERAFLPDEGLRGSERVYRKLGRMLVRGEPAAGARAGEGGELRTRFVVDVLTGTSAGGINAVYLAKALANDQSLDKLMELWVTKGDIGVLLNVESASRFSSGEGEGRRERDLGFEDQPLSPLNSSRMYWELLDALRGMDGQGGDKSEGPRPLYAEELDLYVTATDTRGRVINLRLADKVVEELRHRNVFHFRYRANEGEEPVNDFRPEYNGFLAFAARCTSAHQAAFEVMNMETGGRIVARTDGAPPPELEFRDPRLHKFYEDYLLRAGNIPAAEGGRAGLAADFHGRFFNDGGTLDNSPFSFVSDVLPFRQTLHAVDRKLLYVEPAPEHPTETDPGNERWNFIKNAFAGLSTLPSRQTIVEDLERIRGRNRLVERVGHILTDIRKDIRARNAQAPKGEWSRPRRLDEMRRLKLSQLIEEKGVAWGAYQRLRIAQVTNDLTLLIARAAGIDAESDEFQAVRHLVRYWRRRRYGDREEGAERGPEMTELGFLIDFDLSWAIRRVQFLLRTIDELDCLDDAAREILKAAAVEGVEPTWPAGDEEQREFRAELRAARADLNRVYAGLRAARREFWARRDETALPNPFREEVDALHITKPQLIHLLELPSEAAREAEIRSYLQGDGHAAAFEGLSEEVKRRFKEAMDAARIGCDKAVRRAGAQGTLGPAASVRYALFFYYRFFEDFDQVTFPIFYSTDVGEETDPIEVFRVGPEDAFLLVNERQVNEGRDRKEGRIDKLAGSALGHFGAFFDERYRVNDILWGRLDGAERIIGALLPGKANEGLRVSLVGEAHNEIVREAFGKVLSNLRDPALARDVSAALERAPDEAGWREIEGGLKDLGVGALWRRYLRLRAARPSRDEWRDFRQAFLDSYAEERHYPLTKKIGMGLKGAGVLVKILRANLKENSRKQGPVWRLVAGALLLFGGFFALWVGAAKFAGGLLRLLFRPLRRITERVGGGDEVE
ncbi:MAG TPA: patatin-like protein [Pyrinomonadaceae bacterium]|nr:patatin-like protein [Pyrinomonadaceae bacterium]